MKPPLQFAGTKPPPNPLENVKRLYRECLRRAEFEGKKKGNTPVLKEMIRQQFKRNMHEPDAEKVKAMKQAAMTGLLNHLLLETKGIGKQDKQEKQEQDKQEKLEEQAKQSS